MENRCRATRDFRTRLRTVGLLTLAALATGCPATTVVQTVAKVAVTPPIDSLFVLSHVTLQASLTDDEGRVLKGPLVFWSSQDSAVAAVSSSGEVTGFSPGRVEVAASADGVSGTATITVMPLKVASIHLVPDTLRLMPSDAAKLLATAYNGSGNVVSGLTFTWGSSTPAVATVDQSGTVTALVVGNSTVTAAADGLTGTAAVIVTAPSVAMVTIVPDTLTVAPGAKGQLKATAYDAAGHVLSGLAVTWGSSNESIATVDASGDVTGVAAGSASITASIGGHTGSAKVIVAIPPPIVLAGCNGGTLNETAAVGIIVTGNIDNQCTATLTSTGGSIEIQGNIDHTSTATLVATGGIAFDNQITGGSTVQATAGGAFTLAHDVGGTDGGPGPGGPGPGGPTASALTVFDCGSLGLGGNFHNGAQGKLHSHGPITIAGQVQDKGTDILWWAPSFAVAGGVRAPAKATKDNWGGFSDQY